MAKLKFNFSLKTTIICLLLMSGMIRAAFWQWDRHLQKQAYIEILNQRLEEPIISLTELLKSNLPVDKTTYRRVLLSGEFLFNQEVLISNRRHDDQAGKHIITPLKIDSADQYILVNRGFIPYQLSKKADRQKFQSPARIAFVGLIKEPSEKTFFLQPDDPEPQAGKFFDEWLRVDIKKLSLQSGLKLLPFYVEIMNTEEHAKIVSQIVKSSSDKAAMLLMPARAASLSKKHNTGNQNYPIPVFDTVIPAGRHYGYVWEWSLMALGTFLIGLIIQLKRH